MSSELFTGSFGSGFDPSIVDIVSLTIYRGLALLTGLVFGVMGYKLFVKGVFDKAGDLKAAWGERNLILKQASPGTFFALFGAAIITVTVLSDFQVKRESAAVPENIRTVIAKIVSGKEPEAEERILLAQWLAGRAPVSHIMAGDPEHLEEMLKQFRGSAS